MGSLTEKRDKLINHLKNESGFVSAGIAKRDGKLVLLIAVDGSFQGSVPETFEGVSVVVENLGRAESQIPTRRIAIGF
jgi:hypothetical protein